jgi:hypothetical protein
MMRGHSALFILFTRPYLFPMKSNPNAPSATASPSPSVPMSVYKELAAELQATRAMVDSLNYKNQQLAQQNQTIRQEVERVVQASFNLQQIVEFTTPADGSRTEPIVAYAEPARGGAGKAVSAENRALFPHDPLLSNPLFTEEPSRPQRVAKAPKQPKDLGNFGVALTILVVVLTAFGLGFVAVKQLLPSR